MNKIKGNTIPERISILDDKVDTEVEAYFESQSISRYNACEKHVDKFQLPEKPFFFIYNGKTWNIFLDIKRLKNKIKF